MSLFFIPKKMKNKFEKIQRVFLKGNLWKGNKMQLVNWCKICKEKKFGGLGSRRLEILNWALLDKWLWRFVLEQEGL